MAIKDLLVHLDQTPASERRLQAALTLARRLWRAAHRAAI